MKLRDRLVIGYELVWSSSRAHEEMRRLLHVCMGAARPRGDNWGEIVGEGGGCLGPTLQ